MQRLPIGIQTSEGIREEPAERPPKGLSQVWTHEYAADHRQVICIGVNLGRKKRSITEWRCEPVYTRI